MPPLKRRRYVREQPSVCPDIERLIRCSDTSNSEDSLELTFLSGIIGHLRRKEILRCDSIKAVHTEVEGLRSHCFCAELARR